MKLERISALCGILLSWWLMCFASDTNELTDYIVQLAEVTVHRIRTSYNYIIPNEEDNKVRVSREVHPDSFSG